MAGKIIRNSTEITGVIEDVSYVIQVPKEALNKLLLGHHWRGEVNISLPAKLAVRKAGNRTSAIAKQTSEKRKFKNIVRATVPERQVIRAWNRSSYIQAQEGSANREIRNHPLPFKKIKESLPIVRRAIKTVGTPQIVRATEAYFDFCTRGEHIWEGSNHGYKTVTGFLEKLIAVTKSKETPWWDSKETAVRVVTDPNSKLTKRVANSFAQTFMDEDSYPLEAGTKEHRSFAKTSSQIVNYIARKRRQGILLTEKEMITNLFEFVIDLFNKSDEVIYPSHLASSAIWSAFPQYLQEKGII